MTQKAKSQGDESSDEESPGMDMATLVSQNRKKKKSGGFQSMGLSSEVLRGVLTKGYRVPTPIQRKTIPVILEGKDVVAMARTGSGKTASFLVPMFQKLLLKTASVVGAKSKGARALVLSPTRELALQTLSFTRELGRFCGLKSVCVLGGDSMEKQFSAMHENPDIVIATPGRFVHLCVEMGLKLCGIEYVVFDEADRLFEMGFGEQLREILGRLPETRQTVLFSATLPKLLVDFAKAGLTEPTLIRLDVETKIPETLKLAFFHTRMEVKPALLLHLLTHVIPQEEQVVVFAATRHHVEYLHTLLDKAGIDNTFIYSQLDSTARKINAAKFKIGTTKTRVLVVTDLAARGIDIPMLDNVINYHFPAKSKLFVHRVGRVARAGRRGCAYSLVAQDDLAYFVDLQLFLGQGQVQLQVNGSQDWHNVLGSTPQSVSDEWLDTLKRWHEDMPDLEAQVKTASNGYKQYLKSRPGASNESVKRSKKLQKESKIPIHALLLASREATSEAQADLLEQMKNFRPSATIFEIGNTTKNYQIKSVMAEKRKKDTKVIDKHKLKLQCSNEEESQDDLGDQPRDLVESTPDEIEATFKSVVQPKALKKAKVFTTKKKRPKKIGKDEENFIGYQAKDHHTEAGYSMLTGFEAEASKAVLDLAGDDNASLRKKKTLMRWDAKKKKYVKAEAGNMDSSAGEKKKIKTESGVWIPASYKSDRYAKWRERSKLAQMQEAEQENEEVDEKQSKGKKRSYGGLPAGHPAMKKAKMSVPKHKKGPKLELKRPEQILKDRKIKAKKQNRQQGGGKKKNKGKSRK